MGENRNRLGYDRIAKPGSRLRSKLAPGSPGCVFHFWNLVQVPPAWSRCVCFELKLSITPIKLSVLAVSKCIFVHDFRLEFLFPERLCVSMRQSACVCFGVACVCVPQVCAALPPFVNLQVRSRARCGPDERRIISSHHLIIISAYILIIIYNIVIS